MDENEAGGAHEGFTLPKIVQSVRREGPFGDLPIETLLKPYNLRPSREDYDFRFGVKTQLEGVFQEAEKVLTAFARLTDGRFLGGPARVSFQRVAVEIKRILDQSVIRLWDKAVAPALPQAEILRRRKRVFYPHIARWTQFAETMKGIGAPPIDLPNLYRTSDKLTLAEQFSALLACHAPFSDDIHSCLRLTGLVTASSHYGLIEVQRTPSVAFIFSPNDHELVVGPLSDEHRKWMTVFRPLERADMLAAEAGDQAYGPPTLLGRKADEVRWTPPAFGPQLPWFSQFDARIAAGPINVGAGVLKMTYATWHVAQAMMDAASLAEQNGKIF